MTPNNSTTRELTAEEERILLLSTLPEHIVHMIRSFWASRDPYRRTWIYKIVHTLVSFLSWIHLPLFLALMFGPELWGWPGSLHQMGLMGYMCFYGFLLGSIILRDLLFAWERTRPTPRKAALLLHPSWLRSFMDKQSEGFLYVLLLLGIVISASVLLFLGYWAGLLAWAYVVYIFIMHPRTQTAIKAELQTLYEDRHAFLPNATP